MPVRMEISRILIRELNDYQIIELREVLDESEPGRDAADDESSADSPNGQGRVFPIVIGIVEAQAIERRIKGIQLKRPQTHELLSSVIQEMGGRLKSISITDLAEHTFFATLDVLRADGELVHIDSRPSDAIAIGIANDVPIFVAEHVLEAALRDE